MSGTLCLTFDNMGAARDIAEGRASRPDPDEPGLAIGYPRLLALLDELELRGKHTVPVLQALGFRYDSSTDPDDRSTQPALLAPGLAHIPWRWEMVDSVQYLRHPVRPRTPQELEFSWKDAIKGAARDAANITIVIHAFVSGVDEERLAAVGRLLAYARERMEVVNAGTLAERVLHGGGAG